MSHLEHGDATMRLVSLRGVAHPAVVGGGGEVMIDAQKAGQCHMTLTSLHAALSAGFSHALLRVNRVLLVPQLRA